MPRIDLRRAGPDRLGGVEHRRQRLVFDLDQRGRFAGAARRVGGDRRQYVADIARLLALGDEDGPVGMDLPDPAIARHVGGGRDCGDPGQRERLGNIDAHDPGARMRRQDDGAVDEAGRLDVGDEGALTQGELGALVAPQRRADAAIHDDRRQRGAAELGVLDELDRVDDLLVAGAAAEMPVDEPRDLGALEPLALVGHPFDP